ncbi:MAG: UvrB/UvrC motif-containing protein, partial [Actinomycetota bacterium]
GAAAYLGPFASSRQARLAKDALEDVFKIRRCTTAMRSTTRFAPCALADMGRCLAPCDGRVGLEPYEELVRSLISSLSTPDGLLAALEARMRELAGQERFEEAALARDRLRALAEALARSRTDRWLLSSEELVLRDETGAILTLRGGALDRGDNARPIDDPCPRERADEITALRTWMARNPVRLELASTPLAEPVDGGSALARILGQTSPQIVRQPDGQRVTRSNPHPNGG